MATDKTEAPEPKSRKAHRWPRIIAFFAMFATAFVLVNTFLQPIWPSALYGTSNKDAFYAEPEDTAQCVFVGASTFIDGISPLTIWEEQGISTYNLATEQQPTMMSYYWVKEAHRLHPNTLKAVVIDASMLRRAPDDAWYKKALAGMHLSEVKLEAISDYARNPAEFLSLLFPAADYHDRWSGPSDSDFYKYSLGSTERTRGFIPNYQRVIDQTLPNLPSRDEVASASNPLVITDQSAVMEMNREAISYLANLSAFCNANGIKLIVLKTPGAWSQEAHNATQLLAAQYGFDFLDFNVDPLYSAMQYNGYTDSMDGTHMNYSGAVKLSSNLGAYLASAAQLPSERENPKFSHLNSQVNSWHANIYAMAKQWDEPDVCAYISQSSTPSNTVFITVRDEASASLSAVQRKQLAAMGLTDLASLEYRNSYIAVLEDGRVQMQKVRSYGSAVATKKPLTLSGVLADGTQYTLTSGGKSHGDVASCVIGGADYARNQRGINVVVYDNTMHRVIASTWFDTFSDPYRTSFTAQYLN